MIQNIDNQLQIPTEPITRAFLMDPQTEDLIPGEKLEEGMVVLTEAKWNWSSAPTEGRPHDDYTASRYQENNYWAMVTDLRQTVDVITFIAVYANGHKTQRQYNISYCWYVKLDSVVK